MTRKAIASMPQRRRCKRKAKSPRKTLVRRAASAAKGSQAARVVRRLKADYPAATCALENETPFELLVATILSAQCTDERVNMVTPELFRRWPTAAEMAQAPDQGARDSHSKHRFFRNKAKNIKAASQAIMEQHGGEVPRDMDAAGRAAGRRPQDGERRAGHRLRPGDRRRRRYARDAAQPTAGPHQAHRRR